MGTTLQEIRNWVQRGQNQNATHMIVVCDTFDYEDYPVFVSESQSVKEVEADYNNKSMQRVIEVYNLRIDLEQQFQAVRAFFY